MPGSRLVMVSLMGLGDNGFSPKEAIYSGLESDWLLLLFWLRLSWYLDFVFSPLNGLGSCSWRRSPGQFETCLVRPRNENRRFETPCHPFESHLFGDLQNCVGVTF